MATNLNQVEKSSSQEVALQSSSDAANLVPTKITNLMFEKPPKIRRTMRFGKHWRPLPDKQNVKQGLPPLQGCGASNNANFTDVRGPAEVFTDVGYVFPRGPCYYPSLSALDALYQAYPDMNIMLSTRDSLKAFSSGTVGRF